MNSITENTIWKILGSVKDPEIPVLSVIDLGIIRGVERKKEDDGDCWEISITPTYSGCPAMDMIATQIRMMMYANGITGFKIKQVLSPAWTTEWLSAEGRQKLKAYGIAPPKNSTDDVDIICPNCGSGDNTVLSEFGSTACKSLFRCNVCLEPFDYFKCH